jgi:hypothetical protein
MVLLEAKEEEHEDAKGRRVPLTTFGRRGGNSGLRPLFNKNFNVFMTLKSKKNIKNKYE